MPFNLRPLDQPLPRALSYGILGLMGRTPVQVEQRLIDFFSAKGSMVLTNVPGPRHALSLAGTKLGGCSSGRPARAASR